MTGVASAPRIVVIGGGLSGTAFAIHLLRDHDPAVEIAIVEPAPVLGAGLAYATVDPVHRTNVAASRMSLFSEQPDHFDAWVRAQGLPEADPEAAMPDGRLYPRRALFGRYVHETLRVTRLGAGATLRHVRQRAVSAAPVEGRFRIRLQDGETLDADLLVLAVSHTAPDLPGFLRGLEGNARLVADPWQPQALANIRPDGDVLVVGTGLTGCDVIASLSAHSHRGRIVAVSRRGLLPRPRTTQPVAAFGQFGEAPSRSALALLRRVRAAVREAARQGRPWEDVIDALRAQARTVWGSLPVTERRRLLRHLRPFWDAHRFQSAPQIDAAIRDAQARGRLELLAATPLSAEWKSGRFEVVLHPRGAPAETRLVRDVDAIVNCTGPGHRSVVDRHPVLRALHAAGTLEADPMALGIAVDTQSRVIRPGNPGGDAWDNLFVVGPLARGTHGELMGLPQVSAQPREVAALIATLLPQTAPA
jgi:uncharacterized NAD(P)/FAD-binding protein YdhS